MSDARSRFTVLTMPRAHADIQDIHRFISGDSPQNAGLVIERILNAIEALESMPRRWSLARESPRRSHDLRQVVVSNFRIIFQVVDDRVEVLTVRHTSRRNANDLDR